MPVEKLKVRFENIIFMVSKNFQSSEDYLNWFAELAETLINHSVIVVNKVIKCDDTPI